jgi:hypothetical protein
LETDLPIGKIILNGDLQEIICDGVNWIQLAPYRVQCRVLLNTIMNSDTNSPDAGSSDISSDMKHRTVDG